MITLLLAPLPFILFKYGAQIRENSKYAVTEIEPDDTDEKQRDRPQIPKESMQTATLV